MKRQETEEVCILLDAARGATIRGVLGAFVDLGFVSVTDLEETAAALALPVPRFGLAAVMGCNGIAVEIPTGDVRNASWIAQKIDALHERDCDAAHLLEEVYGQIAVVAAEEQGVPDDPDYGTFGREDVFEELALASIALCAAECDTSSGLFVTPAELGGGVTEDHGVTVNAPASMTTRLLTDFTVMSRVGATGVDLPTAALLAAAADGEADEVAGRMSACGCGVDGDTVTRVYLIGAENAD